MQNVDPSSWNALAQKQLERAMAGDSRAADWCAKHAPETVSGGSDPFGEQLKAMTDEELRLLAGIGERDLDAIGEIAGMVRTLLRGEGDRDTLRKLGWRIGSISNWQGDGMEAHKLVSGPARADEDARLDRVLNLIAGGKQDADDS